jgi:hypothetical protein
LYPMKNSRLQFLPGFRNWNQAKAKESLSVLNRLKFEWLCPSHGSPLRNGPKLQNFLVRYGRNREK